MKFEIGELVMTYKGIGIVKGHFYTGFTHILFPTGETANINNAWIEKVEIND